jgi:MSHA pilin protein MshC
VRRRRRRSRGFTLVELVVVLLLIGILSVVAFARMDSWRVFAERSEYDKVRSALQFARKSAVAKRRYVCVQAAATTLTLTVDGNPPEATSPAFSGTCPFGTALPLPQPEAVDPPCTGAVNVVCLKRTSLTSSAGSFQFDAQGRAAATVTLTVTASPAITVEAETGLVY